MTYRKIWFIAAFILCLSLIGCNQNETQISKNNKDITIYVATDIHYLAKILNDNGEAFQSYNKKSDGKLLHYVDEIVDAFAYEIMQKKPEILIISGDLSNNGEKDSHLKLAEKLNEIEKAAQTKIYVIPGNHDIQNPWARGFKGSKQYKTDIISADDFQNIYQNYGFDEAISRDKASLSYLAAPSDNLWLLMLDTSIYSFNEIMGMPTTNGELKPETLQWINQCSNLAKEKNAKIITVMHHNLFNHNQVLYSGFTLDNSEEALEVFRNNGLDLVLSGHMHIQNIKSSEDQVPIYDIATSSLSMYPIQYGVLDYTATEGFEYRTERVNVEEWARDNRIEDVNLRSFNEYSKNYYSEASFRKAYEALSEVGGYSEEEMQRMAETMSLLNINYFAGTTDMIKEEVINSPGYQLWVNSEKPEFLKKYVLSMLTDTLYDNNHLSVLNKGK